MNQQLKAEDEAEIRKVYKIPVTARLIRARNVSAGVGMTLPFMAMRKLGIAVGDLLQVDVEKGRMVVKHAITAGQKREKARRDYAAKAGVVDRRAKGRSKDKGKVKSRAKVVKPRAKKVVKKVAAKRARKPKQVDNGYPHPASL